VTITNFNHTWPSDVGVALRSPGGQICVLFNNAIGGSGGVTNRTYTFDQDAAMALPTTGFPASGTWRPNNAGGTRTFTGLGSPPYNSNLNIFNGTVPNGTWELFVQDFVAGDSGNIAGGWSISIQTGTPNCSTTAPCLTNVNSQVQMLIYPSATTALFGCPGYPLQATLVGLLTNIGAAPLSNIAIQVTGLGFPDFTNPNAVIPASPNPHRLASADDYAGPCAYTGGQAGSSRPRSTGSRRLALVCRLARWRQGSPRVSSSGCGCLRPVRFACW